MKQTRFLACALSAALIAVPAAAFAAPPQQHPEQQHKAAAHPAYHFSTKHHTQLQKHYRTNHPQERNMHHHWTWHRGARMPEGWQSGVQPLPQEDIVLLPAPPPGYVFGLYDGWAIVYDPNTGLVLEAVSVY